MYVQGLALRPVPKTTASLLSIGFFKTPRPFAIWKTNAKGTTMKKSALALIALLGLAACGGGMPMDDKVISRSDDRSSRPAWATEERPLTEKGGYLYFLGQARLPAEKANISMGYRIAENNAKNSLAGVINQNLTYMFQNAEEGATYDATQIQFVSTESAKAVMSKALPSERYWEKVLSTVNADNDREMFYSIYARVRIRESDLKAAIERTLTENRGISEDLKKKAAQQWDNMVKEMYPAEKPE